MLKQALEYLISLGRGEIENVKGQIYSTQKMYHIPEPTVSPINVGTLSGFVEYIKSQYDGHITGSGFLIHVVSPTEVRAWDGLNRDLNRNLYIRAEAMIPSFDFNYFIDPEHFNIKLQSCFLRNDDRDTILRVVGNLKEENVKNVGDDGVSQSVTAKTGVATVENVMVPNPVLLQPYRTFVEVEQPASNFVFRMQNGPRCALFEADGGAWKLEAMQNIKKYLVDELGSQDITDYVPVVILA